MPGDRDFLWQFGQIRIMKILIKIRKIHGNLIFTQIGWNNFYFWFFGRNWIEIFLFIIIFGLLIEIFFALRINVFIFYKLRFNFRRGLVIPIFIVSLKMRWNCYFLKVKIFLYKILLTAICCFSPILFKWSSIDIAILALELKSLTFLWLNSLLFIISKNTIANKGYILNYNNIPSEIYQSLFVQNVTKPIKLQTIFFVYFPLASNFAFISLKNIETFGLKSLILATIALKISWKIGEFI